VALSEVTGEDDYFSPAEDDDDRPTRLQSLVTLCVSTVCRTLGLRKLKNELPSDLYERCVHYANLREMLIHYDGWLEW